jgi:uncharacterized protein
LLVLLALLLAACGSGEAARSTPAYPALTGRVVDTANLLPPADEAALTARLEALQRTTSRQLVIATVPDMGGYPIEEYANGLFRHWQLGQRTANNGVLLVIARSERRMRIEVGYNLEPIVTDALSSRIIREQITPRFRADDYAGGIRAGADALLAQLQAPPEAAEQTAVQAQQTENGRKSERRGGSGGGSPIALFFWLGVALFILIGLIGSGLRGRLYRGRKGPWGGPGPVVIWGGDDWGGSKRRRRNRGWDDWGGGGWGGGWGGWGGGGSGGGSWGGGSSGGSSWGGGGGSGGGFSGGGGSSGGGGASGSW